MSAKRLSIQGLVDFLDFVAAKGLIPRNTAMGYRSAVAKVQDILTDEERSDVRKIEPDVVFQRFHNLNPNDLSPRSIGEYKRRIATAIGYYDEYLSNPEEFQPRGRATSSDDRTKPRAKKKEAGRHDKEKVTTDKERGSAGKAPPNILELPYPLRSDLVLHVQIPRDLTLAEAERLAAFLRTLATDFEPVESL